MWQMMYELTEEQKRQELEMMANRRAEWLAKHEQKEEWLKRHTCKHCGMHPPIPPWFIGF